MSEKMTNGFMPKIRIKVFGVGGGGVNSVLMYKGKSGNQDIDLIAVNTDAMQLRQAQAAGVDVLQIGAELTGGRGTGGDVKLGEQAAKKDAAKIEEAMKGADMVFITAGLGGGVGTGGAPIVAQIAKEMGILSIGVVTMPFSYEHRDAVAKAGLARLQEQMDAVIAVQNNNLLKLPENRKMSIGKAFEAADRVLYQGIRCIAELILTTGIVNIDFADVRTIFRQSTSSDALLGIGRSDQDALTAVKQAISSPLVDRNIEGARGFILNLTADENLTLLEVNEAAQYVFEHTDPQVNIIFGTVIDSGMNGEIQATIIATDFSDSPAHQSIVPTAPIRPAKKADAGDAGEKGEKAAPAPQPAKPAFDLTLPSFMNEDKGAKKGTPLRFSHPVHPSQTGAQEGQNVQDEPKGKDGEGAQRPSQGAFAIPAFKVTPDLRFPPSDKEK